MCISVNDADIIFIIINDLFNAITVQIEQVVNKVATFFLDKQPVYTITFMNDCGKLLGMVYNFSGTGAVDFVKLKNKEKQMVLADEFDK